MANRRGSCHEPPRMASSMHLKLWRLHCLIKAILSSRNGVE
jgi:hypothetical protein